MRHLVRWAGLVFLCLLVAGCGASRSPATNSAPTATATPVSSATAAPTGTPGSTFVPCDPSVFSGAARFGDLLVAKPTFTNLSNGSYQVPTNTPLKPLQVDAIPPRDNFGRPADTNPVMAPHAGGYNVGICNAAKSQSHTIASVQARLDTFSPFSGQLNAWSVCSGPYDNQVGNVTYEGCGGAYQADYYLLATFAPDAPVGTVVTTTVGAPNSGNGPPLQKTPLPAVLAPNQAIFINVVMVPPTAKGTYTLGFGLTIDNASPLSVAEAPPTLFAPVARWWDGQSCLATAMKSQIPASPHAYYICPAS